MSELQKILEEEYKKAVNTISFDVDLLINMVSEALEIPTIIVEKTDRPKDVTFTLEMIPEIEVSELGWSDVTTPEGGGAPVKGRERELLESYLANILGSEQARGLETLPQQLAKLSSFYENPTQYLAATESRSAKIQQAISLLVFYKTLTKIIANFNASSAGFSFESFLATLLDGVQVPANTGTIADFYAGGTDGVPVSLKLYNEKSVEVGGSFADLVGDLVNDTKDNRMTYLVVMKNLKGGKDDLSGNLTFYQFDFTLDNVMDIIMDTKASSQACIILPLSDEGISDIEAPARIRITPEDVQQRFVANLDALTDYANLVIQSPYFRYGTDEMLELATTSGTLRTYKDLRQRANRDNMEQILRDIKGLEQLSDDEMKGLILQIGASLKQSVSDIQQLRADRKTQIADLLPSFKGLRIPKGADRANRAQLSANIGEAAGASREFYNKKDMDKERKKAALLKTNGYLNELQFSVNRSEVYDLAKPMAKLEIGPAAIQQMLDETRDLLNSEVFTIFESLRNLSDNLNGFFATGLADTDKANSAITDAQNIETQTEKAKSDK
jgi:hypothetical protein